MRSLSDVFKWLPERNATHNTRIGNNAKYALFIEIGILLSHQRLCVRTPWVVINGCD